MFTGKDSTLVHKSQEIESAVVPVVIRPKYLALGYQGLIYLQKSSATGHGGF